MNTFARKMMLCATLCVPLMGAQCDRTTLTYSQKKIVCETADFFRFKPIRESFEKLTADEQLKLRRDLAAYRALNCGA